MWEAKRECLPMRLIPCNPARLSHHHKSMQVGVTPEGGTDVPLLNLRLMSMGKYLGIYWDIIPVVEFGFQVIWIAYTCSEWATRALTSCPHLRPSSQREQFF